ncbi:hypothetical protein ACTD5D_41335 [Nocardia takedensis]|uniref:hypothetical protein n=1 Tax=Nocardia takedensis TaxID=259390 RepID=UPI003F76F0EA
MAVSKSRLMHKLAAALADHTEVRVEATYDGAKRGPRDNYGGWHLRWTDGPTTDQMKALAEHGARQLALDVTEVGYSRSHTDLGQAVAVLLWFDQDPARIVQYEYILTSLTYDIATPERADDIWQQRGRTLIGLDPGNRYLGARQVEIVHEYARAHGWPATLSWLDSHAVPADSAEPQERPRLRLVRDTDPEPRP